MELFGRNRNGELVVSLHDIAGHLCVQRGPRGIRQKIPTPDQAIAVAGDIGLDDDDADQAGREVLRAGRRTGRPGGQDGLENRIQRRPGHRQPRHRLLRRRVGVAQRIPT